MNEKMYRSIGRRAWPSIVTGTMRALNRITTIVPPPPSATGGHERVLVISVHPYGKKPSFTMALAKAVCDSLEAEGHEIRLTNLYDEQFNPVLDKEEYRGFMRAYQDGKMSGDLNKHVEDLKWCSGLVLCYPTWWYSFPAILKGWFDRTFLPGVAFDVPNGVEKPHPKIGLISRLTNIEKVGMVTTFGQGFWNVQYVGDPGRRIVSRGLRPMFHPECTLLWKGLYSVERCSPEARSAFLEDVRASFRTF